MDELSQRLEKGLSEMTVELTVKQKDNLIAYMQLLQNWNKTYNLTAVSDTNEILVRHIFDSLVLLPLIKQRQFKRCLDVGSGAGIPGVLLAICEPQMSVTCIDCVGKKTRFIEQAVIQCGLTNVDVVQQRVERFEGFEYDCIISRAFSSLTQFCQSAAHLLASDGCFWAMKGRNPSNEIEALPEKFVVSEIFTLDVVMQAAERCLVEIKSN